MSDQPFVAKTQTVGSGSDAARRRVAIPAALIVEPSNGTVKFLAFGGGVIAMPNTPPVNTELEKTFSAIVEQWRKETGFHSSPTAKFQHPLYLQIIGLGKDIIPLLLQEVKKGSANWFIALRAITRLPKEKDPVTPEESRTVKQMCEAWLRWGKENNYEV